MHKVNLNPLLISVFIFVLSGCATLNEEQCQTMNWINRGYDDGKEGTSPQQAKKYKEQCAKHKIAIDQNQYLRGHQDGLKLFCTYENGMQQGEDGEKNENVCPQDLAVEFNRGHMAGYKIYKLRKELEDQKEESEKRQKDARRARESSDEETLRGMKECTFDSDCAPRSCTSKYMTVGSASGHVNRCE